MGCHGFSMRWQGLSQWITSLSCLTTLFFGWNAFSTPNKRHSWAVPGISGTLCQLSSLPSMIPTNLRCSYCKWAEGTVSWADPAIGCLQIQAALLLIPPLLPSLDLYIPALFLRAGPYINPHPPASWFRALSRQISNLGDKTKRSFQWQSRYKAKGQEHERGCQKGGRGTTPLATLWNWLSSPNSQRSCCVQKEQALSDLYLMHLRQLNSLEIVYPEFTNPLACILFSLVMLYI